MGSGRNLLCKVVGSGESFAAMWTNVWTLLSVGPYVSSRQEQRQRLSNVPRANQSR